jgi:hypothetical protein
VIDINAPLLALLPPQQSGVLGDERVGGVGTGGPGGSPTRSHYATSANG